MTIATPTVRNMNESQLFILLLSLPFLGLLAVSITAWRERRRERQLLEPLLDGDTPEGAQEQS